MYNATIGLMVISFHKIKFILDFSFELKIIHLFQTNKGTPINQVFMTDRSVV
jgi:hypothetical protein